VDTYLTKELTGLMFGKYDIFGYIEKFTHSFCSFFVFSVSPHWDKLLQVKPVHKNKLLGIVVNFFRPDVLPVTCL